MSIECPLVKKYDVVSFSDSTCTENFVKLFTSKDIGLNVLKNLSEYIKIALLPRYSQFPPYTRSHANDAG